MKKKFTHVRRIDQPRNGTFAWKVQVQRKNHVVSMQFADAKYGGKRKAYAAAIAWRDAAIVRLESMRSRTHDHVYRVESGSKGRYWQGHIQCREVRTREQFHDVDYGGKRGALAAALSWRDQVLSTSQHDRWLRSVSQLRTNNRSGIVGVGRYVSVEISKGFRFERAVWMARWNDHNGKTVCRKFAVKKHGEETARAMAIAARDTAISVATAARLAKLAE